MWNSVLSIKICKAKFFTCTTINKKRPTVRGFHTWERLKNKEFRSSHVAKFSLLTTNAFLDHPIKPCQTAESLWPSSDSSRQFSLTLTVPSLLGVVKHQPKKTLSSNRWSKQCERPSGPTQHAVSDNRAYLGLIGREWKRSATPKLNIEFKMIRKTGSHLRLIGNISDKRKENGTESREGQIFSQ